MLKEDIIEGLLIDYGYVYDTEFLISHQVLLDMPIYTKKHLQQFSVLLGEGRHLATKIEETYLSELDKWTLSEKLRLTEWLSDLRILNTYANFLDLLTLTNTNAVVKWLKVSAKQQLTAYYSDFSSAIVANSAWYPRYEKILYTGGTIRVGKDTQYLARSLGIAQLPFKSLPSSFDYSQQARLYVPTEASGFKELNSAEYIAFVSRTIMLLAKQEQRSILVLFTSHEMLKKVYQKIHYSLLVEGTEVLAQGVSGSREKIMKRFVHSPNTILLGTDSFWEGVDLPGETLEIIIVTRLPFESPERPFVKEKYQYLEAQGIDAFNKYALPKATLRLRQGLGRLIRSEQDRGVLLVLDLRLVKAQYGAQMLRSLPKELPLIEGSLTEILADIKKFL